MRQNGENPHLVKFLLVSAVSFFIGAIHGLFQVYPPVRVWLDSIGSPYGGPGHLIDPLAHAHLNLVGGVVTLAMATTYYLLPILSGKKIYSTALVNYSFWWTSVGVFFFYTTLLVFGIWEGFVLLNHPHDLPQVHRIYGPVVAAAGMTMATGFTIYVVNIVLSLMGRSDESSGPD
jgi:cbb3-type cytochrome oxidase subunit 1